jgi:hypothetical protein
MVTHLFLGLVSLILNRGFALARLFRLRDRLFLLLFLFQDQFLGIDVLGNLDRLKPENPVIQFEIPLQLGRDSRRTAVTRALYFLRTSLKSSSPKVGLTTKMVS